VFLDKIGMLCHPRQSGVLLIECSVESCERVSMGPIECVDRAAGLSLIDLGGDANARANALVGEYCLGFEECVVPYLAAGQNPFDAIAGLFADAGRVGRRCVHGAVELSTSLGQFGESTAVQSFGELREV